MRILVTMPTTHHMIPTHPRGGFEISVAQSAIALKELGHEVTILVNKEGSFTPPGIKHLQFGRSIRIPPKIFKEKFLEDYDVIVHHAGVPTYEKDSYLKWINDKNHRPKKPFIIVFHDPHMLRGDSSKPNSMENFDSPLNEFRHMANRGLIVGGVSKSHTQWMAQSKELGSNMMYLYNPTLDYGWSDRIVTKPRRLIIVSRYATYKNLKVSVKAAGESGIPTDVIISGIYESDNEYRNTPDREESTKSFELKVLPLFRKYPNLTLYTNKTNQFVIDKMKHADLMISASTGESFGRIYAESLSVGTPLLVPDFEISREIIRDCGEYFTFSGSRKSMVKEILTKIESASSIPRDRCRELWHNNYSPVKVGLAYEEVINASINNWDKGGVLHDIYSNV
ncbi:glycosyl transferase [Bacillus phage SP-15]|uniref:Glycosyl transferase n=1 Tax=Bacillus phage SP-15 TaxID=1792032 RepID=A0A127AWI9_9CAUD|nr:glycosyl transferase [Bacillus phage SP-15]AMM44947.1 glycosyl transferase [Bacillus phage SP-15]